MAWQIRSKSPKMIAFQVQFRIHLSKKYLLLTMCGTIYYLWSPPWGSLWLILGQTPVGSIRNMIAGYNLFQQNILIKPRGKPRAARVQHDIFRLRKHEMARRFNSVK